jgi:hypothetical protein
MSLELISTVVGIAGGILGLIGGSVGIYTSVRSNRREEWRTIEVQNDFSLLAAFMQEQRRVGDRVGPIIIDPEIGTTEWQRAEKLVERGILARGQKGRGYRIAGFYEGGANKDQTSKH